MTQYIDLKTALAEFDEYMDGWPIFPIMEIQFKSSDILKTLNPEEYMVIFKEWLHFVGYSVDDVD